MAECKFDGTFCVTHQSWHCEGPSRARSGAVTLLAPDQRYKDEAVKLLEKLLECAKEGEIVSITYVCERPGDICTWGSTSKKDRYKILGFLSHMAWLINQSLDDDATPQTLIDE